MVFANQSTDVEASKLQYRNGKTNTGNPSKRGIRIQSFEDLCAFLIIMGDYKTLWDAVDTHQLKVILPVTLYGTGRDGRVDIWGANFISALQKDIDWTLKKFGNTRLRKRGEVLRTNMSSGSDLTATDYTGLLKAMIDKMDGSQITSCVITGLLLFTGYNAFMRITDIYIERMRLEIQRAEHEQVLMHDERLVEQLAKSNKQLVYEFNAIVNSFANSVEKMGKDPERPIRGYIKSMRKSDTLAIGNSSKYTKEEARKKLRDRPNEPMFCIPGDGRYILQGIELVGNVQAIRIGQDNKKVTAFLESLDDNIKKAILDAVDASMETQQVQEMNLQVDVYFFPNKGVHHAVVIGVGSPRPKRCYTLEDIPKNVPKRHWIACAEED